MGSIVSFMKRNSAIQDPPPATKSSKPIALGLIGAARIAPTGAIIPAKSHPDVVVRAVAARDLDKANAFAKKNQIEVVYSGKNSYQELLADKSIDAVYIALPLALHYEWTMKSLAAGKHVLLEKPSTCTSEDTRRVFEFADQKGLVLLEAVHYRFHPAVQRVKAIVESGELGNIKSLSGDLSIPKGYFIEKDDIRLHHELGGGCMQDMGYYPLSVFRYILGVAPTEVLKVDTNKAVGDPEVDTMTHALLEFPGGVTAEAKCNFYLPPRLGFIPQFPRTSFFIKGDKGELNFSNFIGPHHYHTISVKIGNKTRSENTFTFPDKGEDWWSTYRYQLEAFVDSIRGRTPQYWVTAADSVEQALWIENIYTKGGYKSRPASGFSLT